MSNKNHSTCKNHGYTENVVKVVIKNKTYFRCKICLYAANNFSRRKKASKKIIKDSTKSDTKLKKSQKTFYKPCFVFDTLETLFRGGVHT